MPKTRRRAKRDPPGTVDGADGPEEGGLTMGWGEYLVIADTPELGRAWEDLVRAQCPSVEVTALPELAPDYWAALFGVDCSSVMVCALCGRLVCPGCGPPVTVFVLAKSDGHRVGLGIPVPVTVTACDGCLKHEPEHYTGPERARTARQRVLERAMERRRGPFPGLSALKGSLGRLRGKKGRKIENRQAQRATEDLR